MPWEYSLFASWLFSWNLCKSSRASNTSLNMSVRFDEVEWVEGSWDFAFQLQRDFYVVCRPHWALMELTNGYTCETFSPTRQVIKATLWRIFAHVELILSQASLLQSQSLGAGGSRATVLTASADLWRSASGKTRSPRPSIPFDIFSQNFFFWLRCNNIQEMLRLIRTDRR